MSETPPVPPMPTRSATTGPPPLSRSATSADLRSNAGYDNRPPPPSAGGPPARPPSAGGAMPPRSAAGTPIEGGRAPAKRKPKYASFSLFLPPRTGTDASPPVGTPTSLCKQTTYEKPETGRSSLSSFPHFLFSPPRSPLAFLYSHSRHLSLSMTAAQNEFSLRFKR